MPRTPWQRVGDAEPHADTAGDDPVVIGNRAGDAMRERTGAAFPQRLDEDAGFDTDRACGRAQAAPCASVDAVVVIQRTQRGDLGVIGVSAVEPRPTRATAMRWRGDSVSPRDGHGGSQNPHSMH